MAEIQQPRPREARHIGEQRDKKHAPVRQFGAASPDRPKYNAEQHEIRHETQQGHQEPGEPEGLEHISRPGPEQPERKRRDDQIVGPPVGPGVIRPEDAAIGRAKISPGGIAGHVIHHPEVEEAIAIVAEDRAARVIVQHAQVQNGAEDKETEAEPCDCAVPVHGCDDNLRPARGPRVSG